MSNHRNHSILRLAPDVVRRLAAGECILRPASAVKELIENSLDAKATTIKITVKNGGIKFLQVQDNGIGINKDDLELLCERHTTSKLQTFDQLDSINTFGFRGEAMASISALSHVSIKTKTADSRCGYEVSYIEGIMKGCPEPCGMNNGTLITIENMFYNMPLREKALQKYAEEFKKIEEVVTGYALHYPRTSFLLQKLGVKDVSVVTHLNSTFVKNIQHLFGSEVSRNLLEEEGGDELLQFKYHLAVTNLIFSSSKMKFLLFVNHRLVKSEGLKKDINDLYTIYLPQKKKPFIYISLEMNPQNLDVNVHPSKETVFYLHEEAINKKIISVIERALKGKEAFKAYQGEVESTFMSAQSHNSAPPPPRKANEKTLTNKKNSTQQHQKRTQEAITLDDFAPNSTVENSKNFLDDTAISNFNPPLNSTSIPPNQYRIAKEDISDSNNDDKCVSSVGILKSKVLKKCDHTFRTILKQSTLIKCVKYQHILIEEANRFLLCDLKFFCEEYFYQLILDNFRMHHILKFSEPLKLNFLLRAALRRQPSEIDIKLLISRLIEAAPLLKDFFSIGIDGDANLTGIPLLLDDFLPSKQQLPLLVLGLATNVTWDSEYSCIDGVCQEVAKYYATLPSLDDPFMSYSEWEHFVENSLFKSLKNNLYPSKHLYENYTSKLAYSESIEKLLVPVVDS